MPILLVALLGSFLLAAPAPPPAGGVEAAAPSHSQAYSRFLLAKRALADNDYARAIDEFAQARNLDPASAVVRVELAEVYLRLRRYKDAALEAEKAVELDPESEAGLDLLAQIYESTGETDRALEALRRLVETHPGQSTYLVRMASLQDRAGRTEEAVRLLEEAVSRDPGATDAVFELIERFQSLGRIDRAIETLERAAQADPENLYVHSKLAEFYMQVRDEKKARQALDAMVTVQPSNLQVLLEVARAYRQLDDDVRAARLYRRALLLKPDDESIRVNYATALTRTGNYTEALAEYRKLLSGLDQAGDQSRSPERFEFLKRIGLLEIELGHLKEAVDALSAARPLAPADDVDFLRILSRAYELAGDPARGLALLEEKVRGKSISDPRHADLFLGQATFLILTGSIDAGLKLYHDLAAAQTLELRQHGYIAYALLRKGKEEAAEEVIRAAVRQQPAEEKRAYLYVASLLFEAKQADLGLALAEKLLARYPDDRDLYLQIARAHVRQGDQAQAARVLERAVKLLPEDADLHFQLGAAYERMKRMEEAERELERAITLDPKHAVALNYVAYMLAERGAKLEKALDYSHRALAIDGDSGAFLDTLGWVHFKLGQLEDARQNLALAVERVGEDAVVHEHLGDVLARLGDAVGARREYERALELPGGTEGPGLREKLERVKTLGGGAERKPEE